MMSLLTFQQMTVGMNRSGGSDPHDDRAVMLIVYTFLVRRLPKG